MSAILLNSLNVTKSVTNTTTSQVSGLTTLNGGINDSTTTITLTSTAQTVSTGGTILIDNEYITYTGISGNNLQGVVRGAFYSTAASHSNGASVYGVFVGEAELNPQPNVACSMSSDQAGTLFFQYSNNGTTFSSFPVNGYNVAANIGEFQTGVKLLRYFRIIFKNLSSTKTTTLNTNVYYGTFGQPQLPLNQSITDDYTSTLVRSVLTGQTPTNTFDNIRSDGPAFITSTNLKGTTLTVDVSSSFVGNISLASASGFPLSGYIYINSEYLSYTYDGIDPSFVTITGRGLLNSTSASHLSGATVGEAYVTSILSLNGYTEVATKINCSNTGSLNFQWYSDSAGTNLVRQIISPYTNVNTYDYLAAPNFAPYTRYIFANTQPTTTTKFFYTTDFYTKSISAQVLTMNSTIASGMTSNLTRSVNVGQEPSGTFTNERADGYAFQTTTPITVNTPFTSSVISTAGYSQIQTELYSDVSGVLTGTWYTESTGTSQPFRTFTRPFDASNGYAYFSSPIFGPYVKYSYATDASQNSFYLGFKLLTDPISGQIVNLTDFISNSMVANLGRNVIVGETDGGQFINVPVTNEGHLEVAIHDPINPFYSLHTENYEPLSQSQGVYAYSTSTDPSLNPLIFNTFTIGGALTECSGNLITAKTTNTTAYNCSQVNDIKVSSYSPGQGLVARFTGLFDQSANNVSQIIGISNGQDTLGFGYNGTSSEFGIFYNSFGVLPVWSVNVATVTNPATATITLNGIAVNVSLTTTSTTDAAYTISRARFNGWTTYVIGSTIYFQYFQPITTTTLTATGTNITFGTVVSEVAGAQPSRQFIAQSQWNGDKCNGTGKSGFNLNPRRGNIFQIDVQYLGFGTFNFKVEVTNNNNNSIMINCHTISNPNSLTKPTLSIPSFNFLCYVDSSGNSTVRRVSSGSFGIFSEGIKKYYGNRFTHNRNFTLPASIVTNPVPFYTIQNSLLFNKKMNKKTINCANLRMSSRPPTSGGAVQANTVTISIYKNSNVVGSNFAQYNSSYSVANFDTSSTAFQTVPPPNQQLITSYILVDSDSFSQMLDDINIYPGETLTFAYQTTTVNSPNVGFSLNVREDD